MNIEKCFYCGQPGASYSARHPENKDGEIYVHKYCTKSPSPGSPSEARGSQSHPHPVAEGRQSPGLEEAIAAGAHWNFCVRTIDASQPCNCVPPYLRAQAPASSPRDLEAVPADGLRMICRSYMYVQAGPLRDAANWIARVLAAKDFPQETEAWKRAHPPKGETPSEAAGDLEAMFAQGEIIGYEIDRMPGKASVRLEWMEYAENCPEGWSSTGRGYGPDVPAALEAAKKKMPRKDPQ